MSPYILDYRKTETFDDVAEFLGLRSQDLQRAISASRSPDAKPIVYVRHRIPKCRPREVRTVWDVASQQIRDAHRTFSWRFGDFTRDVVPEFPHAAAYGYIRGRGIFDNAAQHLGARKLLRCDLKNFFSTITLERLVGRFIQIGIQHSAARVLAEFLTIEGVLALGLNGSPMLANLVCLDLDAQLHGLALRRQSRYTRYADDIAFSGDEIPPIEEITDIIEGQGFQLSQGKTRQTTIGQAHFVTGLSISDKKAPRVPRQFKRQMRQELYYCTRFGIRSHVERAKIDRSYQKAINRLDGSIRFIRSIETQLGDDMRQIWYAAMIKEGATVSYGPVFTRPNTSQTYLVDETEFDVGGAHYLAVACVSTDQLPVIQQHASATLRQHLNGPFTAGRKEPLLSKGLHFADAHDELRNSYLLLLRYLPFRAYIAFGRLDAADRYEDLFCQLLSLLLTQRFKSNDRASVIVLIERNGKVSASRLQSLVHALYSELESRNERRPIASPECLVRAKAEEPGLALPDALLWVFQRAFSARDGNSEVEFLRFERIREKYRHIDNTDTGEVFSRRHPIEIRRRTVAN